MLNQRVCDEHTIPSISSINRILRNASAFDAEGVLRQSEMLNPFSAVQASTFPMVSAQHMANPFNPFTIPGLSYPKLVQPLEEEDKTTNTEKEKMISDTRTQLVRRCENHQSKNKYNKTPLCALYCLLKNLYNFFHSYVM